MIWTVSQVALGGALGAAARFLGTQGLLRLLGSGFPFGTMLVNVLGSFLMGALFALLSRRELMGYAPFLLTGVLGGFTTFSAFSLDALNLYERGEVVLSGVYILASVGLSIAALLAGVAAMRGMLG